MQIAGSEVEIIDQLAEKLENLGYSVVKNAIINGQSGAEHSFEIIAAKDDSFTNYQVAIGVSVSRKGTVGLNSIFNFDEKAYDAGISYKAFVAIPKLSTMPANFANRQRIRVFDEKGLQDFLTGPTPTLPKEYMKIDLSSRAHLADSLTANSYTITEGAKVKGTSGVEYTFNILACIDDGLVNHQIGIDFIRADNEVSLEQVSSFDTKAYDVGVQFKMLVVSPKLSDTAEKLVKKQRIQIIVVDEQTIERLLKEPKTEAEDVVLLLREPEVVMGEPETKDTIAKEHLVEGKAFEESIVKEAVDEKSLMEEQIDKEQAPDVEPTGPVSAAHAGRVNTLIKASTREALELIPEHIARKYKVVPLSVADNTLHIAMANPNDILAIEDIEVRIKKRIFPIKAAEDDIKEAIDYNYRSSLELQKPSTVKELPHEAITPEKIEVKEGDITPVDKALNLLVEEAIKSRATDIHIEPEDDRVRIRYRIDGILKEVAPLPASLYSQIMTHIKTSAGMNVADSWHPQKGQFIMNSRGKDIDVRASTIGTVKGETVTLKLLDKSMAILSLSELGLQPESRNKLELMLKAPYGMILASGPNGSGTTTTLNALINCFDKTARNIVTIEDPVEYHIAGINQIQINSKSGLTFASTLRAVLTQNPDVIIVSELRDSETVKIAAQAALAGKLILGVVHANDSTGVLFRLIELGIEPFLLSSTVIGTIAQRMIRRVCQHCARKLPAPSVEQTAFYSETGEKCSEFNYGAGCKACTHTGYLGRTTIFEVFNVTDEIRQLLVSGAKAPEIRSKAIEEGMITLAKDGMLKVKNGMTTPQEVLRNVYGVV